MAAQRIPDVETLLAKAVEGVGGEPRPGQLTMAAAAAKTMRSGGHLLVQAGTGTGKSLAYLVPAVAYALTDGVMSGREEGGGVTEGGRSEGEAAHDETTADGSEPLPGREGPVIVATATIALQRQLIERDLPKLIESLGPALPRTPTFAILKGRRNYLCLQRFHAGPDDTRQGELFDGDSRDPSAGAETAGDRAAGAAADKPIAPSSALGREIVRVGEWANRTDTGDRDELAPGVSERVWSQFAVSARECLGASKCPYGADCFAEQARMRAMRADIVVTNHALLAIDAIGDVAVLPEHEVVVVDEAHELVDRVTGAATEELTSGIVERAAKRCHRLAPDESARLDEAAAALALAVAELPTGQLSPLPQALVEVLELVRDGSRAALGAMSSSDASVKSDPSAADVEVVRKQARAAVEAIFDTTQRLLADSQDDVIWSAYEDRRGVVLRVAPLKVADLLHNALFSQRTTVLTSATLTLGGSFDPLAASLGIGAKDRWQGLDVGSPFDHTRQGILYVARHLPPPGRDGLSEAVLDELAALIDAAGGRTLGLFSSMRAAAAAAEEMRSRLDYAVMCQGDDSTGELVRLFAKDAPSCLFGTLSLWQGVDVPGASCQLVVVDRIPFPRPDDPLISARQRAVAEAGGNGFMAVAASQAALLLAQGTGRLLRSRHDRGVVAVLDSRLDTARYGGFLRKSLPPFWYTTDPAVVRKSLRALDEAAGGRRKAAPAEEPMLEV
ncbi:MAG: ATP-dependent DNA helicase [Acidothermaceae bacterium]